MWVVVFDVTWEVDVGMVGRHRVAQVLTWLQSMWWWWGQ
jgi:hypothetical protein